MTINKLASFLRINNAILENKLTIYLLYPLYFFLVAIPPLRCLSDLFLSSTNLTSPASCGFSFFKRSVMSLCTVDFEMPKCLAAARTVALFSLIYVPMSIVRSSRKSIASLRVFGSIQYMTQRKKTCR